MSPNSPIAILDSGLGALTLARAIRMRLPREQVLYLADTARGPYAARSAASIERCVRQLLSYARGFEPKQVVIACNTAAGVTLPAIKAEFADLSISGIVDPAAKAAVEAAGGLATPVIAVLAAEGTIRSRAFERAVHRRRHHARLLLRPVPLLEALVDEGRPLGDPVLRLTLRQYLEPLVARGTNVLVLGSAHCSQLCGLIESAVGETITVVDGVACCAEDVARRLQAAGLLRGGEEPGGVHCLLTDETPRFPMIVRRLLGEEPLTPKVLVPEELLEISEGEPPRRASA